MLIPIVRAGIEQRSEIAAFRVEPREVGSFVQIAIDARQCEVHGRTTLLGSFFQPKRL